MRNLRRKPPASEERLKKLKKEFGWIDQHTITDTNNANGGPGVDRRF